MILMNDFFTWTMLATYAGATLATTLITQLLKGIPVSTRILAYVVALVVLVIANFFTGGLTVESGVLCLINAGVVSLASNGAFDAVATGIKKIENK
jgi:hypothetical protein